MVNSRPAVFLFAGNDSYAKEQAIKKLKQSLFDNSSPEFDYKVFNAADSEVRDILDYVSTAPFLASKRLVVIKHFDKFSKEDCVRLVKMINNPSKSTCLVLDAGDDSLIKDHPGISRNIIVQRFGELTDSQFQSRVKEILSSVRSDKKISNDAAMELRELRGSDMGSISQELQKLASFIGDRAQIEANDVEEITGKNLNASVFDLTDALEVSDIEKALSIISELILSGKKHYEIIGLLCWHMKRLFKGRMLLENGTADSQIANALKIGRRYQDRFFGQLKASPLAQVESKMKVLLETDLDIKRSRYDPSIALEFAVIKLCLGLR